MVDSDDGSISDLSGLLRRVHPEQVVPGASSGEWRVSSAAFRDLNLSTDCEEKMLAAGVPAEWTVAKHSGWSLVRFTAAVSRQIGMSVVNRPLDSDPGRNGEPNPYHAEVQGKKTQGAVNSLKQVCDWVVCKPPKA